MINISCFVRDCLNGFCYMWKQCQHESIYNIAFDIIPGLCVLLVAYLPQIVLYTGVTLESTHICSHS